MRSDCVLVDSNNEQIEGWVGGGGGGGGGELLFLVHHV